jgi:hypothetical protein
MTKINVHSWQESIHDVNNQILTNELIVKSFKQFVLELNQLIKEKESKQKIIVQFKIELENGLIRTISRMQTITNNEYKLLLDIFTEYWSIKTEEYHLVVIQKVIFTYKIVPSKFPTRLSPVVKPKPSFTFKGYDLPNTMDLTQWGEYKFSPNYHSAIIKKPKSKAYYSVVLKDSEQLVELKIHDKILLTFIDKMNNNNDLSSFTRVIHEHTYIFREGNLILKQKNIKNIKYLTKVIGASHISYKFVSMDLETRAINGIITPYAISIYDGKDKISFYLSDYPTSDEMLIAAISSLLRKKYDQYKVYIHNFSHFDSVFMIKVLSNMNLNIIPLIRDGRFKTELK